jgi:hypothetical protein
MTKIYLLPFLFAASFTPLNAQSTEKVENKPKMTVVATLGGGDNTTIYIIDGVRTNSPLDFYNIKSEDVYSMEIMTDPAEIKRTYARNGEKFKSVIVVETVKRPKPTETMVSDAQGKSKN